MGDNSRDPIDHERTSRPRVGQALKSPAKVPGLLFVAAGAVAFAFCLVLFVHGQVGAGIVAVVISLLAAGVGSIWLAREARRVREIEAQHNKQRGLAD
jgi:CHASE2 domain-containing sensor protein